MVSVGEPLRTEPLEAPFAALHRPPPETPMFADFARLMNPAHLSATALRDNPFMKQAVELGQRNLELQKELVSWQLAQAKAAETQAMELWTLSLDNTRKAFDRAVELQGKALQAMAPAETPAS